MPVQAKMNVWADLPVPLSDILRYEVLPFLNVEDLVRLSAVSRRYRAIFDCKQGEGCAKMMANLLRRDALHRPPGGGVGGFSYSEQLPTIGRLSVEDSLELDPLLVAQLRKPATRRRKLILLHYHHENQQKDDEALQLQLRPIIRSFQPKTAMEMIGLHQAFCPREGRSFHGSTYFAAINLSGVDIHCHWIDNDGEITVRDGDTIAPAPDELGRPHSFVVNHDAHRASNPGYCFGHSSFLTHAFALCFEAGGLPFAIYQSRTCWEGFPLQHIHAIAILPGGRVEELRADCVQQGGHGGQWNFVMIDRGTNSIVLSPEQQSFMAQSSDMQEPVPPTVVSPRVLLSRSRNARDGVRSHDDTEELSIGAKKYLARAFYGFQVPPVDHPCWQQGVASVAFVIGSGRGPGGPLTLVDSVSAALWRSDEQERRAEAAQEAASHAQGPRGEHQTQREAEMQLQVAAVRQQVPDGTRQRDAAAQQQGPAARKRSRLIGRLLRSLGCRR